MIHSSKIKTFVDNLILGKLNQGGYDTTRNHLYSQILKNRDIVKLNLNNSKFKFSDENIDKCIKDNRTRYLAYFVIFSEKRVLDLFHIENKYRKFGFDPLKTFKLLLLKEKLMP